MHEPTFLDSHVEPCPPEMALSVYVDRELEPEEARRVDVHLLHCRACREIVVALDEETVALRTALFAEESVEVERPAENVAESLVWSVGMAAAASFAGLGAGAWALVSLLPSDLDWLNPFDVGALFTLFFDTAVVLREQGPALYQFGVASAAILSASFLLTSSFTLAIRRLVSPRSAMMLLGLAYPIAWSAMPATAIEFLTDQETLTIEVDEVVEQTWFTTAESVEIEGTLRGDLMAFGDRVVIKGLLDGNLVSGARRIEIEGRVTGSIVTFGDRVRIAGEVDRNVYSAAGQTTLAEGGRVGGDLASVGDGLQVSGLVARDLMAYLDWLELRGEVGRDLVARVEEIDVVSTARIGRDLELYHREEPAQLVVDDAAMVGGETRIEPAESEHPGRWHRFSSTGFYVRFVLSWAAAFLAGLLIFRLAPWVLHGTFRTSRDLLRPLGVGFVTVFAVPIGLVLVGLTIVGLPIAIFGFAAFALCLYLAKIAVGSAVGLALLETPLEPRWRDFARPLVVGLLIVSVATEIPVLGWLVGFAVLLVGSGAVVLRVGERLRS